MAAEPNRDHPGDSLAARLVRLHTSLAGTTRTFARGGTTLTLDVVRNPGIIDIDDIAKETDDIVVRVMHWRPVSDAPAGSPAVDVLHSVQWRKQRVYTLDRTNPADDILACTCGDACVRATIDRWRVLRDDRLLPLIVARTWRVLDKLTEVRDGG